MSWWEAVLLAVVEGLTEFLPISSTGHLILLSAWLGRAKEAFVQDYEIIIQGGAILAVLFHSYRRLYQWRLYLLLLAAFCPTAFIGVLTKEYIEGLLGSPAVVAINLILGGVILIQMDRWFLQAHRPIESLKMWEAGVIGLIQALSLMPGISRAAAALFGGRLVGLSQSDAAEFSFLLAVPTLTAASAYKAYKSPVALSPETLPLLGIGIVVAFGVATFAMQFLITLWRRYGLLPFGVYRIILGSGVLIWVSLS
ncbi:MAG: undecaprenyl-diphosphate phosphatase [Bacteroidia bacterium]|nr:undecaprenyl-diphosphate phosphatase [Bacteroidia bacterium]MDW8014713.1 undecaprenyl-diphosphate phosphatase [Bacteroidia bacterium]